MSDLSACCAIAIMAKASIAGAVKTRLVPPLSPAEAAGLAVPDRRTLHLFVLAALFQGVV